MTCPRLTGERIKQCDAVSCTVVLSGCELQRFCVDGDFRRCPVYLASIGREHDKLSLDEYASIYSSWARMGVYSSRSVKGPAVTRRPGRRLEARAANSGAF